MSTIDIIVPEEQEGTSAVVRNWLKSVGDRIEADDPLVELETDKVTQEVPAPQSGVLVEILMNTDDEAAPGDILGRIEISTSETTPKTTEAANAKTATSTVAQKTPAHSGENSQFLSPAVKRALSRLNVDPANIQGTGKNGRITVADVENAATKSTPTVALIKPEATTKPTASSGASTKLPHNNMRLSIARNMVNSVTTAPHVTSIFEADLSAIISHRAANKAEFEVQGAKLTFTAYFVAACAAAMQTAPAINSQWHEDHLELFSDVNVGVATSLGDDGLLVPVIRQAQNLSLLEIATRLTDMTRRARENQLSPQDVKGGTFTISNYGTSGALVAAPVIINQPQSAILGIGKTEKRVVVREVDGVDTMQIRPIACVSLTMDHRVVDGHQTNSWLAAFVDVLENWPS